MILLLLLGSEVNGWLVSAIGALAAAVGYLYINNQRQLNEFSKQLGDIINNKDQTITEIQNKRISDLMQSNRDYIDLTQKFAEFMKQVETIISQHNGDSGITKRER